MITAVERAERVWERFAHEVRTTSHPDPAAILKRLIAAEIIQTVREVTRPPRSIVAHQKSPERCHGDFPGCDNPEHV